MRLTRSAAPVLAFALIASGCGGPEATHERPPFLDKIGQNCTIQLRRGDALGAGADLPVSPTTGSINGASVSVSGTLRASADGWVTIEAEQSEFCIPRESILLIQFNRQSVPVAR